MTVNPNDHLISLIWKYGVYDLTEIERENILLPIIKEQIRNALINPHIRSYYEKVSMNPEDISSLADVPWVPVTMFKEFDLATVPADDIVKILRSSGTTGQQTSKIPLDKITIQNQNRSLSKSRKQIKKFGIISIHMTSPRTV